MKILDSEWAIRDPTDHAFVEQFEYAYDLQSLGVLGQGVSWSAEIERDRQMDGLCSRCRQPRSAHVAPRSAESEED